MIEFDPREAQSLAGWIVEAESHLESYLSKCFPKGARCAVYLAHGQTTPTKATIHGVNATRYGGEVCVVIDTAKARTRLPYRRVPASSVVDVAAAHAAHDKKGGE